MDEPIPTAPDASPHPDGLARGERLLAEYRPALRVYARRVSVWATLSATMFFVGASWFGVLSPLAWLLGFPLAMLAFVFAFGDLQEWRLRRGDRWLLTDRRLIFRNPDEPEGEGIALNRVAGLRVGPWGLTLRLSDGTALNMSYLPDRRGVRDSILEARDHNQGAPHD